MNSDGEDDSRGDAGMDADDDALQAEVTATQTREKLNDALIKVRMLCCHLRVMHASARARAPEHPSSHIPSATACTPTNVTAP